MKKKLLSAIIAPVLCASMLPFGIAASAASVNVDPRDMAPHIYRDACFFDSENGVLNTTFSTMDVDSRYFESYVLTLEDITSVMGTMTINNVVYNLLGIMSFDGDDTGHVAVKEVKGEEYVDVTLSQQQYFAENAIPQPGDEIYIAVQTEGSHDEENWGEGSEYSEPVKLTVQETGKGTPPAPEGVSVTVNSMEYGESYVEGYTGQLTGKVANISVRFAKIFGWNHFLVSPFRSDLTKVMCGTMPFIHNLPYDQGSLGFESSEIDEPQSQELSTSAAGFEGNIINEGPNGEIITETPDFITVEMNVLTCEEFPENFPFGYCDGENMIIGVANLSSDMTAESEIVTVEIPFDESSVGKTFEAFVPDPLENTSVISSEEIIKGEEVTITASATGGYGDYQYTVLAKKDTSTSYSTVAKYSANTEIKFKPSSTGNYDIVVRAKDSKGNVARKQFRLKVNGVLKNTSTISAEEIVKGNEVTVSASATGGYGDYEYTVLAKKEASTSYSTIAKYSSDSEIRYKPSSTGNYDIVVKVRDSKGNTVRKQFSLKVNGILKNTSTISAETVKKGESVTVNASAEGGMGDYEYAVLFKKASSSTYTTASKFSSKSEVVITPGAATDYSIVVKVKDASGKTARKEFRLTVEK